MKKERNVWAITSLIAFWWLTPNQTNAQQDSVKTYHLDEVVVTASRQNTTLLETPRTVSVISQEQIQNSPFNSVGDLLAQRPGIYLVGANQNPGSNQSLFLRGANSNQVVVLIDGVRITDPSSPNNVIDLSELSLTNVDRIELVEGSHSTMYGGSAVGGAINIITKKGRGKGIHGSFAAQGGTYEKNTGSYLQSLELNYGLKSGLYFSASQMGQYVHGLNASLSPPSSTAKPERDDFRKTDRYVKAGYQVNKWDAFVAYKKTGQQADIDNGAFQDKTNNTLNFDRDLLNYSVSYQISFSLKLSAIGSWSSSKRLNENDSSLLSGGAYDGNYFKGTYKGKIQSHEVQLAYQKNNIKGVVGMGTYQEDMSFKTFFYSSSFGGYSSSVNYDSINSTTSTRYLFTQLTFRKADSPLGITTGGRWSNHSLFGSYLTYELNPFYQLRTLMIYGSLSSGFNSPSLYQLYDPTQDYGAVTNRGNQSLGPEKSSSFELGVKKEFAKGSFLTVSLFNTITSNSIEYVYLWNKDKAINTLDYTDYRGDTYLNMARQTVRGIEVDGTIRLNKAISFRGNVTWLSGNLKFTPKNISTAKTEGNYVQVYSNGAFMDNSETRSSLVRRPSLTAFASLIFQIKPKLQLSTDGRLAGSRFDSFYDPSLGPYGALGRQNISSYVLFNSSLNWNASDAFSLTIKCENIFDTHYSEIAGFTTRGRSFYLKFSVRW